MTNQELIQKIRGLKAVKARAEFREFSRGILLSQIQAMKPKIAAQKVVLDREMSWWFYWRSLAEEMFGARLMQPAAALLLLLGFVLGSSLTVNAAFYSLPGGFLYPLKIRLEKTQLALVRDEVSKTELKIEFARKRVAELDKIVAQPEESGNKAKKINLVVNRFKEEVAAVKNQIKNLDQEKKSVFKIAMTVDSATMQLAQTLTGQAEKLPEETRAVVKEAASSAEAAGLSALATMVNSATTTPSELAGGDLTKSLQEKVVNLESKIQQLADKAEAEKLIKEAKASLAAGDFNQTLAKISELKILLDQLEKAGKPVEAAATGGETAEQLSEDELMETTAAVIEPG